MNNNSNFGIRDVNPTERKLSTIANRYSIVEQKIHPYHFNKHTDENDVTQIPDYVSLKIPGQPSEQAHTNDLTIDQ